MSQAENRNKNLDADRPDAPDSNHTGGRRIWLSLLAGCIALPVCLCAAVVFLVLTGILAEPETVIEQILRAIFSG